MLKKIMMCCALFFGIASVKAATVDLSNEKMHEAEQRASFFHDNEQKIKDLAAYVVALKANGISDEDLMSKVAAYAGVDVEENHDDIDAEVEDNTNSSDKKLSAKVYLILAGTLLTGVILGGGALYWYYQDEIKKGQKYYEYKKSFEDMVKHASMAALAGGKSEDFEAFIKKCGSQLDDFKKAVDEVMQDPKGAMDAIFGNSRGVRATAPGIRR